MASRENFVAFFNAADTDRSGEVSLKELQAVLCDKGGYSKSYVQNMFRQADTSGDGQMSLDEFLAMMGCVEPKEHKRATYMQVFREFDKNGDGTIDKSELKAVFKELGKNLSERDSEMMIKLADKDASGTLDYKEFVEQVFGKQV